MADVQEVEKGNGAEREEGPGAEKGGGLEAEVEVDGLDPPVQARTGKQKTGIVFSNYNQCHSDKIS